jgi:hypothetical protein
MSRDNLQRDPTTQWCFTARSNRPLVFLRRDPTAPVGLCQDSTDKRSIICFVYQTDSSFYHQFAGELFS